MKPLIGALTAGIALVDITDACRQIGDKSEILYLSYQNYEEAGNVLLSNLKRLDGIIYGGHRGFMVARPPSDSTIPFEILRIGKADFFELLLKAVVVDKMELHRISVDCIDRAVMLEDIKNILPQSKTPYVFSSTEEIADFADILQFHENLYATGKIDCVMTGLASVAKQLKAKGIKYYYIQPSVHTIADALERVTNKALANTINGGLSVLGIVACADKDYYRLYRLLLEFATTCCPHMVVNRNADSCHLITQNRWFAELTHGYTKPTLIQWLKEHGREDVGIGWGIGSGLGFASDNANIALEQSLSQGLGHCYITNEDKMVSGPIGATHSFSYSRVLTPTLQSISEKSGLSVLYIQKLKGMWQQLPDRNLSCTHIGLYLGISRRSANRVLGALEQSGYATVTLVHTGVGRGRPTKMYTLNLD